MPLSNWICPALDLSIRIAMARSLGTDASPEDLLSIIDDLTTGRDEELRDLRETTDRELSDMRMNLNDAETESSSLEDAMDTVMVHLRTAAKNHKDDGAIQQLYQDVNTALPYRFRDCP